jgi:hypothetical protein
MTAIACLRLLKGEDAFPAVQAQAAANSYLAARWMPPRRYGAVAPLAFVLADLRARQIDPAEVQAMAAELEALLFPERSGGKVCLMTFEGDETAVLKFATLTQAELAELYRGEGSAGPAGRVQAITAEEIRAVPSTREEAAVARAAAASAPAPAKAPAKVEPKPRPESLAPTGWWGLYDLANEGFCGSQLGLRADLAEPPPLDDDKLLTRDLTGLNDAYPLLQAAAFGDLYLPLGFWNLTTPASQESYKRRLTRYPAELQPRLGTSVYGTPREASLGLLSQIRALLKPSFAFLDLNVQDPTFPVHNLPQELINSVTFALPEGDERQRLAAIQTFLERQSTYRGKGVLQGVTGVRTAGELDACREGGIARVSGTAITAFLDRPVEAAEGAPCSQDRQAA